MDNNQIKKHIEEFIKNTGLTIDSIEVIEKDQMGPTFSIKSADSKFLIGVGGETLRSFNILIKKIIAKQLKLEKDPVFSIDVNGYRNTSLSRLEHKARLLADRAVSFKTTVDLDPMSSYERMYIHSLFTNHPYIKTESVGEGKNRHLTLKYVENSEKMI
jgi:spoIIIJ-associated protein